MGERCTQARFLGSRPAKLRSTNKSSICTRCEESGLLPTNEQSAEGSRPKIEIRGEEAKVRTFKDDLTVQLYLQKGAFWDAVLEVREKWGIVALTQLPPSGPGISGLILPEHAPDGDQEFFRIVDEWIEDIGRVEERCIPARFRDSAEWKDFISACILFDPPEGQFLEFTKHGDPRYLDYARPGGQGDRVPLQARAPLRWLADESELEATHLWLLESLLEELGRRHLEPLGLDIEKMVEDVFDNTDLRAQYNSKKRDLAKRWHIRVESGITFDDVRKSFSLIPSAEKGRSSGGRPRRNSLIELECAILYDRHNRVDENGRTRWTFSRLAEKYGLPTNEVSEYVKEGRQLLSQAERE